MSATPPTRGPFDRVVTAVIFALLLLAMVVGLGANVSTVAMQLGGQIWEGYAAELRTDPDPPTCDLGELDERLSACPDDASAPTPEPASDDDPFDGEDPFGDGDPFADDEAPEPADEPADPFAGEGDPFAEEGDPFAEEEDPFAEEGDPFAEDPEPSDVNCPALRNLRDRCAADHEAYADFTARLTPSVRAFRSVETAISEVSKFPYSKHLLLLLVLLGGLQTTRHRAHISLRDPESVLEHRISQSAQLLAFIAWGVSCIDFWRVKQSGGAEADNLELYPMWAAGFAVLAVVNILHLVRPPDFETQRDLSLPRLLMVVPLFAYMALLGFVWFVLLEDTASGERNWSGQAIYLTGFLRVPSIYIGIGLYIWAGMLLAKTRVARLVFDLLVPFELPPNLLAWLVVVLAALPTAYSGASGIFVIAAGAVIFERLTAYGARPRIALAATAMSGSLGVVLRPCLVVVLVAVLNKEVTTDALFGWGRWVFALTAGLFLVAMLIRNREPLKLPPMGPALKKSGTAFLPLLPYLGIGAVMLVVYAFVLGTWVTEHTAAFVLPGILLAWMLWDRRAATGTPEDPHTWRALSSGTGESAHHIGALLFVMAGSVGVGGVVERSEVMSLLPEDLGSPFTAMCFLVVVMVLVGMTMDALGAVILVSVTLKGVALANGIHPVHFWMMVLCAFELGYLTPPVALNHLLARQVIGTDADMENVPADNWFHRHEHILVPMLVMGTALLIVAFVPLLWL